MTPVDTEIQAHNTPEAHREKQSVALISLLAAILLTSMKLGVGLWTNSLGILSEAAHSGLDLVAAGITLWAVRVSSRPPDQQHTYGHGKFENLSALAETLLLLLTCVWIFWEAGHRLFLGKNAAVEASVWAFLTVMVSIVIDFSRSRALKRAADKYHSEALQADALHFSTDIWSSLVVLGGLVLVRVAQATGWVWLEKADAAAAAGVALIVVWVSFRLGRQSIDHLLDSVPPGLRSRVAAAAWVPGVERVSRVRVRRSGPDFFTDVTLAVGHRTDFAEAHQIADASEAAIRAVLPGADVMVHLEPVASRGEDAPTVIRLVAARHGLGDHSIRVYEHDGGRSVELHLEVDGGLSLEEGHRQVSAFEKTLRQELPGIARIVTHIEPAGRPGAVQPADPALEGRILRLLQEWLVANRISAQPHEVQVRLNGEEMDVSFHCALEPGISVEDAHALSERLEIHLRNRLPRLGRVVIHAEPDGEK
jgi:cation diffusion facilitator family transporter